MILNPSVPKPVDAGWLHLPLHCGTTASGSRRLTWCAFGIFARPSPPPTHNWVGGAHYTWIATSCSCSKQLVGWRRPTESQIVALSPRDNNVYDFDDDDDNDNDGLKRNLRGLIFCFPFCRCSCMLQPATTSLHMWVYVSWGMFLFYFVHSEHRTIWSFHSMVGDFSWMILRKSVSKQNIHNFSFIFPQARRYDLC